MPRATTKLELIAAADAQWDKMWAMKKIKAYYSATKQ